MKRKDNSNSRERLHPNEGLNSQYNISVVSLLSGNESNTWDEQKVENILEEENKGLQLYGRVCWTPSFQAGVVHKCFLWRLREYPQLIQLIFQLIQFWSMEY